MQKFIKENSKKMLALVIASLTVVSLGNMNQVKAQEGGNPDVVCPGTDNGVVNAEGWIKFNNVNDDEDFGAKYTADSGYIIDEICVKGGKEGTSANGYRVFLKQNGPSVELGGFLFAEGIQTQTASVYKNQTSTGIEYANISHASFHVTTNSDDNGDDQGDEDQITPVPAGQKTSALGNNGPTCTNNEFEVTMDLKDENGNGVKDVLVTFTYRNEKKEARTNDDGRARVFYNFSGEESVKAEADGFATQSMFIKASMCPVTSGSATTSSNTTETRSNGQVLGASTLADTGMSLWQQALVLGLILSTISSVSLVKNRK